MKNILVGFLSFVSISLYAQKGITQLPVINQFPAVDLRGHTGIAADDTGRIWMSYSGFYPVPTLPFRPSSLGLLTMGSDSSWRNIRLDSIGGPQTKYLTSIQFQDHALWLGSDKGLIRKKGSMLNVYKHPAPNIPGDTVNGFCIKGSTYYIAKQNGINILYNILSPNWVQYDTTNSSLPTNRIYGIDAQSNGILWLATDKGVIRFDPAKNESTVYNKRNTELRFDTILCIKVLPNGDVWAGGMNNGLSPSNGDYDQVPGLYKFVDGTFKNLITLIGVCDFKMIPKIDFYQLYSEGNMIVFAGTASRYNLATISNQWAGYYSAIYKTDGIAITYMPYKPPVYDYFKFYLARQGNSYYIATNTNSVKVLNLNTYVPDSGWYYYQHAGDTSTNFYTAESIEYLNINNTSVPVKIKGDLFWGDYKLDKFTSGEKGTCKSFILTGALWMGGIANGNLHLAAGTYRQSGIDYMPGPLKPLVAGTTPQNMLKYSHHWKLEQRTIETFKKSYNLPGYNIPAEILSWHAHGDTANGFPGNLAPFVDANHNGRYEPQLGDYPMIKGQQELYWIFNDNGAIHSETEGLPLGVEVHGSAYGYVCDKVSSTDPDKAVNNTTFYRYKIINRSSNTYENFRIGFWLDCDLGFWQDDRIGSNPKEDYVYWYNGDTLDETIKGYGSTLPAAAVVLLKGIKDSMNNKLHAASLMTYNNDFSNDVGNPRAPQHFYNYLCGKWKNGSAVTYGGNGLGGTDSIDVSFFPGNNDRLNRPLWTEESAGIPAGDRRLLINLPAVTLKPGEEQEVEYALVYTPTNSNDKDFILGELHKDVMKVKGWYALDSFPHCSSFPLVLNDVINKSKIEVMVYPNPATNQVYVEISNGQPIAALSIYSINGALVQRTKDNNLKQIDISALAPGLYILKIETREGSYARKIIKE